VRLRVAKIDEHAVTHVSGDVTAITADDIRDLRLVRPEDFLQILRIKAGGESCRAHEVAKHHRELPPFGVMRRLGVMVVRRIPCRDLSNGIEDFSTMADSQDSDFL
jgi:hypothetical protein